MPATFERPPRGGPTSTPSPIDWPRAFERLFAQPELVQPVLQPVLDLSRGTVCGYEVLARFEGETTAPTPVWFDAASRHKLAGRLEALIVRRALERLPTIPEPCFISINLSPQALVSAEVHEATDAAGSLDRVSFEITEQTEVRDYDVLHEVLGRLRAAGASIAIDDAGAGYTSIRHILSLRPEFVKLDRGLVADIDADDAKAAVVETLQTLTQRIDALLVAEGVERREELDRLIALGVPLGQGFALARPKLGAEGIDERIGEYVRARAAHVVREGVGALVERLPAVAHRAGRETLARLFWKDAELQHLPVVDGEMRPVGVASRTAVEHGEGLRAPLLIEAGSPVAEVARRAMERAPEERFDPMVCCDDRGRYIGLVRVERLVEELVA